MDCSPSTLSAVHRRDADPIARLRDLVSKERIRVLVCSTSLQLDTGYNKVVKPITDIIWSIIKANLLVIMLIILFVIVVASMKRK